MHACMLFWHSHSTKSGEVSGRQVFQQAKYIDLASINSDSTASFIYSPVYRHVHVHTYTHYIHDIV